MKVENCEILNISDYNRRQKAKWEEDVEKWHKAQDNNIIPQIAFYFFPVSKPTMSGHRETGFVCVCGSAHFWRKTKRECVKIARGE